MAERAMPKKTAKKPAEDKQAIALEKVFTPVETASIAKDKYGVVNVESLNVRNKTSKERGSVIMVISKGTRVMILDTLEGWYRIEVANKVGFCMKEFITEV